MAGERNGRERNGRERNGSREKWQQREMAGEQEKLQ